MVTFMGFLLFLMITFMGLYCFACLHLWVSKKSSTVFDDCITVLQGYIDGFCTILNDYIHGYLQ